MWRLARCLVLLPSCIGCGPGLMQSPALSPPVVVPPTPVVVPTVPSQPTADLQSVPMASAAAVVSLPAREGEQRYHQVQSGETWAGIARQYGLTASTLQQANGLDANTDLQPGQMLWIPNDRP